MVAFAPQRIGQITNRATFGKLIRQIETRLFLEFESAAEFYSWLYRIEHRYNLKYINFVCRNMYIDYVAYIISTYIILTYRTNIRPIHTRCLFTPTLFRPELIFKSSLSFSDRVLLCLHDSA